MESYDYRKHTVHSLTQEEKDYIKDFIQERPCSIPTHLREDSMRFMTSLSSFLVQMRIVWSTPHYIQRSNRVKERSYSHQVIKPICDLLLHEIPGIDREFDGESQSTKNRNGGERGPKRHPDVMISKNYHGQLKAELVFVEISYGPYSRDEDHYLDDEVRLGKFSKDSWNHIRFYLQKFGSPDILSELEQLEHFAIHFHGTKMDVYVVDRKMSPFHRMNNNAMLTIRIMNDLCETLLTLNGMIKLNFRLLDRIIRSINDVTPENNCLENIFFRTHKSPGSYRK